ncbi:MAG TPA: permease [Ignavibacteriales bacterium]|nr:permease [Ignavibacteriales bacterium]
MSLNVSKKLLLFVSLFVFIFILPLSESVLQAILASIHLLKWYAQEHTVLCLIPAFFIAGAITNLLNQAFIIKYLSTKSNKYLAYLIASVSGAILSVCSCTILPLFSSIHKKGAGLGPAVTFLYSGPAISVIAIVMTTKVFGLELGIVRAISSIIISIFIGILMEFIFKENNNISDTKNFTSTSITNLANAMVLISLVTILLFLNWFSNDSLSILSFTIKIKWLVSYLAFAFLLFIVYKYFGIKLMHIITILLTTIIFSIFSINLGISEKIQPILPVSAAIIAFSYFSLKSSNIIKDLTLSAWEYAQLIIPYLALGTIIAGFLFGFNQWGLNYKGIIPGDFIKTILGGNGFLQSLFASIIGTFMYFATLTEVPILQGLMANGMGKGPALALFLSGPSLSLPSLLVINKILGLKKTTFYAILVILLSTFAGTIYGLF